jgi:hypothetical protein
MADPPFDPRLERCPTYGMTPFSYGNLAYERDLPPPPHMSNFESCRLRWVTAFGGMFEALQSSQLREPIQPFNRH